MFCKKTVFIYLAGEFLIVLLLLKILSELKAFQDKWVFVSCVQQHNQGSRFNDLEEFDLDLESSDPPPLSFQPCVQ